MTRHASNTLVPLALTITLALGAFALRLYDLQVVRHQEYSTASNDNHYKIEPVRSLRGEVYARDGKTVLITNRIAYDLMYKGGEVKFFERIAVLADIKDPLPKVSEGEEVVLKPNIPVQDGRAVALSEWISGQPSLEIRQRVERIYPTHSSGNLLGYTRLATESDERDGYIIDDSVGAAGVEQGLDAHLRGRNGLKYIEVDAKGNAINERIEVEAQPGNDVTLTIDPTLQTAAEKAISEAGETINKLNTRYGKPPVREARGAIVALDPRNGEILALATGPKFDPNWFAQRPGPPEKQKALADLTYKPLWNRAVKVYEPGSTFKLVTSSALIESAFGNRVYNCSGYLAWGGRAWRNWTGRNLGNMDTRGAIQHSCNTWYYQAAVGAGPQEFGEVLAKRAREFGFGEKTGVELPNEDVGLVPGIGSIPSPAAYRAKGLRWENGFTLNYSIGQGDMRANPLQIARMLATIVMDGKRPELTLLSKVHGKPVAAKPTVQLSGKHWSVLKEGMSWTTQRPKGTANHELGPDHFPIKTGGKTGTAQNPAGRFQDHAWYMGYGPLENPSIVVVAFFENGVEGSGSALPAVKRVMAAYWKVPLDERGKWIKPDDEKQAAAR